MASHGFHFLALVIYINITYIQNLKTHEWQRQFLWPIALSLCYPTYYEFKQVFRDGLGYFMDLQNFIDVLYILVCLASCFH